MTREKGHCLCGAVRFEADGVEQHHKVCHCHLCRRRGGGPCFTAAAVRVADEAAGKRFSSSDGAERGFRGARGTQLFYRPKAKNLNVMKVGVPDHADAFGVTGEIVVDEKPGGYAFAGDHPRPTGEGAMATFTGQGA